MKWVWRILIVLLVVLAVSVFTGYRLLHGQPTWYHPHQVDPDQREVMAQQVEAKLAETVNWSQSAWLNHQHPDRDPSPDPFELSLTEDQINSFISKWDQSKMLSNELGNVLSDPQVELDDHHVVIAVTVKQTGTVLSVRLSPSIDDQGQLHLVVDKVQGGELPLPKLLWNQYSDRATREIDDELTDVRKDAKMLPDGSANSAMVEVVLGKLLLNLIAGKPADPVVFLKCPVENQLRNLPVKITAESLENKTLKLKFEPLKKGELLPVEGSSQN